MELRSKPPMGIYVTDLTHLLHRNIYRGFDGNKVLQPTYNLELLTVQGTSYCAENIFIREFVDVQLSRN